MYTNRGPDAKPKGHANFYPNGGANQSHCPPAPDWGCSHWRAVDFYAESITTNKFVSKHCDLWDDFREGKCDENPTAFMGGLIPDMKLVFPPDSFLLVLTTHTPYVNVLKIFSGQEENTSCTQILIHHMQKDRIMNRINMIVSIKRN